MFKRKSKLSLLFSISLLALCLTACGETSQGDSSVTPDDTEQNDSNNDDTSTSEKGTFTNPIEVTIKEANEIASNLKNDSVTEEYYKCTGTVTQLKIEPKETHFILNKDSQNILVYYIVNIEDYPRLNNGDEVTIISQLKNYNSHKEFHRARITNAIHNTPEVIRTSINEALFSDTSITYTSIKDVLSIAKELPQDQESQGTVEKYHVKGFVQIVITPSGTNRHFYLCETIDCSEDSKIFVNIDKPTYNELATKYETGDEVILYGSLRHTQSPQIYHPEIKALRVHN